MKLQLRLKGLEEKAHNGKRPIQLPWAIKYRSDVPSVMARMPAKRIDTARVSRLWSLSVPSCWLDSEFAISSRLRESPEGRIDWRQVGHSADLLSKGRA